MVRREGWFDQDTPKGSTKVYARLDGYILSLTKDDTAGSINCGLVDLRYCRSLHAKDVYAPTGPFEIQCQDGKGYTLNVTKGEHETPDQQRANRESWLSLFASGVPDRASEGR